MAQQVGKRFLLATLTLQRSLQHGYGFGFWSVYFKSASFKIYQKAKVRGCIVPFSTKKKADDYDDILINKFKLISMKYSMTNIELLG
jgi:hypothetical protein